jgi:conjugal transfer/entry exclusion protein
MYDERLVPLLIDHTEALRENSLCSIQDLSDKLTKSHKNTLYFQSERDKAVSANEKLSQEIAELQDTVSALNSKLREVSGRNLATRAINQIIYAKTLLKKGSLTSKRLEKAIAILNGDIK